MSSPAAVPAAAADARPPSALDAPITVLWSARPGEEFVIRGWMRKDARNRFVELAPARGPGPTLPSVPFDELELADKTIPDVLGAMRVLRDFKHRECSILRASPPGAQAGTDFMEMVSDVSHNMDFSLHDPLPKRHQTMVAVWRGATQLDQVPESDRDEKLCAIALESDILNYPAVPERFRTDALDAQYVQAKRAKRKRDE